MAKVSFKFDERSLQKTLNAFKQAEKKLGYTMGDMVVRLAKYTVISASKYTMPGRGKKNPSAKSKKRRFIKDFKKRWNVNLDSYAKAGVFYYNSKGKGLKLFKTKKQANKFKKKKYWGLARFGWLSAVNKLGGNTTAYKATNEAKSLGSRFNKLIKKIGKSKASIVIINAVPNIEKHSRYSGIIGMNNANKRMKLELNKQIKKLEKSIQQKVR